MEKITKICVCVPVCIVATNNNQYLVSYQSGQLRAKLLSGKQTLIIITSTTIKLYNNTTKMPIIMIIATIIIIIGMCGSAVKAETTCKRSKWQLGITTTTKTITKTTSTTIETTTITPAITKKKKQ